ncbi:hypothetical protein Niako_3619 [Niastella koreensis GR20-10]|uniref:Uncharacterized protein n=1 Tax=Niastella koreensis (strain DSM 17620 / KACC 11465 / NBRC 106392 / GR20-10) TaxID=700598 RepID=G8TNK2_NIAKG|nr:hypothetical protein Niako_3619 [Niastella koreensis GR20-10]
MIFIEPCVNYTAIKPTIIKGLIGTAKPEVMKLSTLQSKIPTYGTVQGIKPGESGYYNHR